MEKQEIDLTQVQRLNVPPSMYHKLMALPEVKGNDPSEQVFPSLHRLTGIQIIAHELVPPGIMIAVMADGRHVLIKITDNKEEGRKQ